VHCAEENKISAFVIYIGMAANLKNVNPIKTNKVIKTLKFTEEIFPRTPHLKPSGLANLIMMSTYMV
jgi:hypothetical protein